VSKIDGITAPDEPWLRVTTLDEQPVLRNLLVTQGYHELSAAHACALGHKNVTWFSFATWSSKVVGAFIQNERLPTLLRRWVDGSDEASDRLARLNQQLTSLRGRIQDAPAVALDMALRSAINDTRMYLATGNTEVFLELAPVFGGFVRAFGSDRRPDLDRLARFTATLRVGPPEPDRVAIDASTHELRLVGRGGQTLLAEAVGHYYAAKFEADPKRRAELMLLGNAKIGLHEQTRLQTYIEEALGAPIANMLAVARRKLLKLAPRDAALSARWAELAERQLSSVVPYAQMLFSRFATELMMALKLPDGAVGLAADLPPVSGQPLYPDALRSIADPELAALLARFAAPGARAGAVRNPLALGTGSGPLLSRLSPLRVRSGATDWCSLHQRMRFILELFRSRQQNQRLLEPVFRLDQITALERGMIPAGPLT
jgi:hypothetical protein